MPTANTNPIFPHAYKRAHAAISAANTAFDGTGTIVEVLEAAAADANGYLIRKIAVKAEVTTTAGQIKLFLSPDAGTTWEPWFGIPVTVVTAAAGTPPFEAQLDDVNDEQLTGGLVLESGWSLGAATHNAEAFNVHVEYGVL